MYHNDYIKLYNKKGELVAEGYFNSINRYTSGMEILSHDNSKFTGKKTNIFTFKTKGAIEKYVVDYLGNLYKVKKEKRLAFHRK
ncbi:MAG: hypothetical protein NZZ41_07415 [Candidatus Dojkabacteria bacterium]|nr:hypothetical protein [Candidatus Dojkabacteria bacterium]